jgi:hypothetical protein
MRAVSFGDDPHGVPRCGPVAAEQSETSFQAISVFFAVFFANLTPIAHDVAREELQGALSGFFKHGQRAGCSNELAQVKQRLPFGLLDF